MVLDLWERKKNYSAKLLASNFAKSFKLNLHSNEHFYTQLLRFSFRVMNWAYLVFPMLLGLLVGVQAASLPQTVYGAGEISQGFAIGG